MLMTKFILLFTTILLSSISYSQNNNNDTIVFQPNYYLKNIFLSKCNNLYGLANSSKELITPIKYTSPPMYSLFGQNHPATTFEINGKIGLVSIKGEELLSAQFDSVDYTGIRYHVLLMTKNNKKGLINFKGEILVNYVYDDLNFQNPQYNYAVSSKEGKLGLLDSKGNIILDNQFTSLDFYRSDSILKVATEDQEGYYFIYSNSN